MDKCCSKPSDDSQDKSCQCASVKHNACCSADEKTTNAKCCSDNDCCKGQEESGDKETVKKACC